LGSGSGSGSDTPPDDTDGGGCSAGGHGSLWLALGLVGLVRGRRRRATLAA
jgi:MYXO-CTERM domain-containing protein